MGARQSLSTRCRKAKKEEADTLSLVLLLGHDHRVSHMQRSRPFRYRHPLFRLLCLIAVTWACADHEEIVPSAAAQDDGALNDARVKFQRGIELKHAKDWSGALRLFRQVGSVRMTPQVRYHIASCEEKLGQLVVALGGYELALAQSEGMAPDFISTVEAAISELKARIPKLTIERGEGAESAVIELDGVELGESSLGKLTPLDPGPHTVVATAAGYQKFQETVVLDEGTEEKFSVKLEPEIVEQQPEATPVVEPQSNEPARFGKLPYIVGGSGTVVAIVGGVLLGVSQGQARKARESCGGEVSDGELFCAPGTSDEELDEVDSKLNSAAGLEAAGWVSLGVGAAGLATGVTMFFLDRGRVSPDDTASNIQLLSSAPGSDWGFSVSGRF